MAEHMYKRSTQHNFSLAFYNLGYMFEKNNKIKESINYYIKASDYVNEPLTYRKIFHFDKMLEISLNIILFMTNLKLFKYFLLNNKYDESKKYFNRSIICLSNINRNKFCFKIQIKPQENQLNEIFSIFKNYIINYIPFYFFNQVNFNNQNNEYRINKEHEKMTVKYEKKFIADDKVVNNLKDKVLINSQNFNDDDFNHNNIKEIEFDDAEQLFDFFIKNIKSTSEYLNSFIAEINSIIRIMETIIYKPPYQILFGRILFNNVTNQNDIIYKVKRQEINQFFYDGFGII